MQSSTPARRSDLVTSGKLTAELLIEVELSTLQELRAVEPVAAWRRIQAKHPERATLACLYALQSLFLGRRCPKPSKRSCLPDPERLVTLSHFANAGETDSTPALSLSYRRIVGKSL